MWSSHVFAVCLVTLAGWLELRLAWAGGLKHFVLAYLGQLKLAETEMGMGSSGLSS